MTNRPSDHRQSSLRRIAPTTPGRDDGKEPLQIRIPTAVKRRFKAHAALRGLEPNQLFVEIWNYYEATYAMLSQESPKE